MNRIFMIYGASILLAFAGATYKGYAASSMFSNRHHSTGSGYGSSGGHYYHSYHK